MAETGGSIKIKAFKVMVIVWLGLWSCVSMPPEVEKPLRSCDPQADAAVNAEDWDLALLLHQKILADNPDNCLAIYHLGYVWGHLGDREKEIAGYERAVSCGYDQDDMLYFNLGMAYAELDRPEKAIVSFERAVALKPENADNHFGLGLTARLADRMDLACRALSDAVAIDPRHWDARIELARIELDQGRLDAARIQLEAVQKGAPAHEELQSLWRIYHDRKITVYDAGKM